MNVQQVVVAAGCFWGVQYYFDQVPGVVSTVAGYAGGTVPNPTYDAVASGKTGHAESLQITFDAKKVSYEDILRHFFRLHDPTQLNRQGPDIGTEYRSAIFYASPEQQAGAVQIRNEAQRTLGKQIVTEITPLKTFYEAEPYQQKFSERTGIGMCHVPYEPLSKTAPA
jgi:peptide methionine sulfoxide reductase msrA/msrB